MPPVEQYHNWPDIIFMIGFASSDSVHSSIQMLPFQVTYGYYLVLLLPNLSHIPDACFSYEFEAAKDFLKD